MKDAYKVLGYVTSGMGCWPPMDCSKAEEPLIYITTACHDDMRSGFFLTPNSLTAMRDSVVTFSQFATMVCV